MGKKRGRPIKKTPERHIYDKVVERYGGSVAPLFVKLGEIAHTLRGSDCDPGAYFDRIIETLSDAINDQHRRDEVPALYMLLQFVLPLVPKQSITADTAERAARIVVEGSDVSCVSALLECFAILLRFCRFSRWEGGAVESGLKKLIVLSMDERRQLRKSAQLCAVLVFNYLEHESSEVKDSASKFFIESVKEHMKSALREPEPESALYLLEVLRYVLPLLPTTYITEAIKALDTPVGEAKSSPMVMRRVLDLMELTLGFFEGRFDETKTDDIVKIKEEWVVPYFSVMCRMAGPGFLTSAAEETTATRASKILTEKIKFVAMNVDDSENEASWVGSLWAEVEKALTKHTNENTLAVMAACFLNFGITSGINTDKVLVKLAGLMKNESGDTKRHLQKCLGAAVARFGPEKVLELFPISKDGGCFDPDNAWLIPILKDYVIEAPLRYFNTRIWPLAESLREACNKEENPVAREQLKGHERGCFGLLPAFCCLPTDMDDQFKPLADEMIKWLDKDDAFMHEVISIALQLLVKQILGKRIVGKKFRGGYEAFKRWPIFNGKSSVNREAMSKCSGDLLKAYIRLLARGTPPAFVEETIRYLTLVTQPSEVEEIYFSAIEDEGVPTVDGSSGPSIRDALVHDLTPLLLDKETRYDPDPFYLTYLTIKGRLQRCGEEDRVGAYVLLSKVLEESSGFMTTNYEQVLDLLVDMEMESPPSMALLKAHLSCFKPLLRHSMEACCDGKNDHGNLILAQFIVKPDDEQSIKVAAEVLLDTISMLQTSSIKPGHPYQLIDMILWFLFDSPGHVTIAAVFILSELISLDSKICDLNPALVPSVLELMDAEDSLPVIQAVLGFANALVLNVERGKLLKFRSYIDRALSPWLEVSDPDIKQQVTSILHHMNSKCDDVSFFPLLPADVQKKIQDKVVSFLGETSTSQTETSTPHPPPRRSRRRNVTPPPPPPHSPPRRSSRIINLTWGGNQPVNNPTLELMGWVEISSLPTRQL